MVTARVVVIERVVPNRRWHALEDDQVVGRAHLRRRPDGRAFVAADAWREPVTRALLDAVAADVPSELYTLAGEDETDQLALLAAAGYQVTRREDEFVRRGLACALLHAALTPLAERGIELVSAEADVTNTPSQALLASLGARRTGGSVELRRPGEG